MAMDVTKMGFGITGTVDHDVVRELAPRLEAAGFRTLWINHGGAGNSLASMQVAASVTSTLRLASGVIPVDRVPASEVVQSVRERALPIDRIVLGIGASSPPSPLTTIREASSVISSGTGARVVVGALGPKMRRLGVLETDGLLLNWLTPDAAKLAMSDKDRDLGDRGQASAGISLYIRTALENDSLPVLEQEVARYEGVASYAANFKRLGFEAKDSAVFGTDAASIRAGLERYVGIVDEPVVRAITPHDTLDEFIAILDAVVG